MPIYAYSCTNCGLKQDVMQKMNDAPLSICPECGQQTLVKQLTAAGFQLKGDGYYVTDFKNGPKKPDSGKPESGKPEVKPDAASVPAANAAPTAVTSGAAQA